MSSVETRHLILFAFLFVSESALSQVSPPRVTTDYPQNGVELGSGWNSVSSEKILSTCVAFVPHTDPGQNKIVQLRNVSDRSSLMTSINVSAGAQVKAIVGSGSFKTEFANSMQVSSNTTDVSIDALVQNSPQYVYPAADGKVDLKPEFATLAHSNPAQFYKTCGDSFVSARYGGAELIAVASIKGMSLDIERSFKTDVNASGTGFSANGSVAQQLKNAAAQNLLQLQYHETGGSGGTLATDVAGLNVMLGDLANQAKAAPSYFQVELTSYEALPSWTGVPKTLVVTEISRIATRYWQFLSLRGAVEDVLNNPSLYILNTTDSESLGIADPGVSIQKLRDMDDQLLTHIQHLKAAAQSCVDSSGTHCHIDSADDVTDYAFRIQMPLEKRIFALGAEIGDLTTTLNYAKSALVTVKDGSPAFYQSLQLTVQNFSSTIASDRQKLPGVLKQNIGDKWITFVARERCNQDPNNLDCISNAQIDAWIGRIVIL